MLAVEVAGQQVGVELAGRWRRCSSVRKAIAAMASRAIAVSTAAAGESPQQNGPCDATSTAGESMAVRPALASVSTMTRPVSHS